MWSYIMKIKFHNSSGVKVNSGSLFTLKTRTLSRWLLPAAASVLTAMALDKVGNMTVTFQTEMLSMNLSGSAGGMPIMIRESPTLASTGRTTITDVGSGTNRLYRIDSFFDVNTELSMNGGTNWIASAGP